MAEEKSKERNHGEQLEIMGQIVERSQKILADFASASSNAQTASNIYMTLMAGLENGDNTVVAQNTDILVADHAGNRHGTVARLDERSDLRGQIRRGLRE